MTRARIFAVSLGLVLVATGALPARAFLCTRASAEGPSLAWGTRDVVLRPSAEPASEVRSEEVSEALRAAGAAWSAPACSDFRFWLGETTDESRVGFDWQAGSAASVNQNIVIFRRGRAVSERDAWLHPMGAIAITTVTYVRANGRIVDADIEMNDAGFVFSACDPDEIGCRVQHDLANTLTHELGHVLGLDHPPSSQPSAAEATMFSVSSPGDLAKRDLAEDDIAGLCTIYPADAPMGECYGVERPDLPEVRVERAGCAQSPAPWGLPVLALCGLGWRARRRPRRWRPGVPGGRPGQESDMRP